MKHIIVCANNFSANDATIEIAAKFSANQNARLTGFYIMNDSVNRYYAYEHLSEEFMSTLIEDEKWRAEEAKENFYKLADKHSCAVDWHSLWESEEPTRYMFYSDLIVVGHNKEKSNVLFDGSSFINTILLETARPILLIPDTWSKDCVGQHVMLAWNESKESVRAMHEALPLMQQAEKVDVVTINSEGEVDKSMGAGIEITAYLTQCGVNCQLFAKETNAAFPKVGAALLNHVKQNDNDLIVMGGYGHSRLREILLGGVTNHLINHSDVPLFILH